MEEVIQYENWGGSFLQLKINNINKTYKIGHFNLKADKTVEKMQDIYKTIHNLKKNGYRESE